MRRLTITDAPTKVLALQDEIHRSEESRYDHRLHALLLVAQGMSPQEVARLFGDAPRTVQYWVRQFEAKGLSGLRESHRPGRPRRLQPDQLAQVKSVLQMRPCDVGLDGDNWDGKTVAAFIEQKFSVELKARQCRNLLRQLRYPSHTIESRHAAIRP